KFGNELFNAGIQVRHGGSGNGDNSSNNLSIGTASDNRMDIPAPKRKIIAQIAGLVNRKYSDSTIIKVRNYRSSSVSYGKIAKAMGLTKRQVRHLSNRKFSTLGLTLDKLRCSVVSNTQVSET